MKLSKLLMVVAASAMCSGLVACGGETQVTYGDVSTPINVWATAQEEAVINKIVGDYNAQQEDDSSKFNITFTAVAEGDAGTTLAKDPTVANAPALFLCADDHLNNLVNLGIVSEIRGDRAERITDNNMAESVAGVTNGGSIYGFPVTNDNGYFLWYDSSALTDVSSLEGILAAAKAAKKTVLMDVPNGWYVNSFFMASNACGTNSLKWKAGTERNVYDITWDSAKGVKVAEYINSLLEPYYEDGTLVVGSNDAITAGFQAGKMIAAVSGTWMENELKNAIGDKLAASKLPSYTIDGESYQMATFAGTKLYAINKTRPSAEQRVAASLADLLTTKEAQLVRFETRQTLPCNLEAQEDARFTENVTIGGRALMEQQQYSAVQAQSAEDRYWDIGKAIGQALIDGNLGTGVETWADFMKAQCDLLRV